MSLFPFFMDISNSMGLLIGGGMVAKRKAERLAPFGAKLTVIAPEILTELEALEYVEPVRRGFLAEDIERMRPAYVIAASDDREVNHMAATIAREKGIPVNVADDAEYCTFQFPALVTRGDLTVGISTHGKSPTAAAAIRRTIEQQLPCNTEDLLAGMDALRERVKREVPKERRSAVLGECWEYCLAHGALPDEDALKGLMEGNRGFVSLVGAGCGTADLITLRGMQRLIRCDAVVYDALIDPMLISLAPERARQIPVGKRAGAHSAKQEEINDILVSLAKEGLNVVRLKGGDPYVFGRGGEEAEALDREGIRWEEIPGVPSAIAIPAQYGIPVTHRNVSRGFHVITAHTSGEELPEDLPVLAKLSGTLVFLMGLNRLGRLADALVGYGKPEDTPAAVLSGGNSPHPACVRGTLRDIEARVKEVGVQAPAVIVVGDVAAMELGERE